MEQDCDATLCYYGTNDTVVKVVATIHKGTTIIEKREFLVSEYNDYEELSDVIVEYARKHHVKELYNLYEILPVSEIGNTMLN